MDRNNDILNEKSNKSEKDCINNIGYFHKLVKDSREIFSEANDMFFEAIDLAVKAIDLQEDGLELQDKGKDVQDKYFKWLDEYGYQYECNFDSEICDKLLEGIYNLETKIENLEESGLDLVIEGVNKWKLARKLTNKLIGMEEEYTECIHNIHENCKANISEEDFEISDNKECNKYYESSNSKECKECNEYYESSDSKESNENYGSRNLENDFSEEYNDDYDILEDKSKDYYEYGNKEGNKKYYCEKDDDEQWYFKYKINNGITDKSNTNVFNGNGSVKKNHRIRRS